AQATAAALDGITTGAKKINMLINSISEASNSQSDSMQQVTMGIEQISAVVQTNSATAEESAAASEELSSQAQMLKTLMARFKVEDNAKSNGANNDYVPLNSADASFGGSTKY
ncbi:MAG: methyl-accepting chemotaxis protein, partial [Oscillospiraceae bacterium]